MSVSEVGVKPINQSSVCEPNGLPAAAAFGLCEDQAVIERERNVEGRAKRRIGCGGQVLRERWRGGGEIEAREK